MVVNILDQSRDHMEGN